MRICIAALLFSLPTTLQTMDKLEQKAKAFECDAHEIAVRACYNKASEILNGNNASVGIRSLFAAHQDVNFRKNVLLYQGEQGTLLHQIVAKNWHRVENKKGLVEEVMMFGAAYSINIQDQRTGETPLMASVKKRRGEGFLPTDVALYLIECKADVSLPSGKNEYAHDLLQEEYAHVKDWMSRNMKPAYPSCKNYEEYTQSLKKLIELTALSKK